MIERQMLGVGLRAIGILILFQSTSSILVVVFSAYIEFDSIAFDDIIHPAKAAAAFLLVRYADAIASYLSDPNVTDDAPLLPTTRWSNWLVICAAVLGVAPTFCGAMLGAVSTYLGYLFTMSHLSFGAIVVFEFVTVLALSAVLELSILGWLFGAVVNKQHWLMGEQTNDA